MEKGKKTRATILQKGLQLIYARGFYNTSLDDLLAAVPITKGSFYHHFRSKDEMGLAIIHEVLRPAMLGIFRQHMVDKHKPVESIIGLLRALLFDTPDLRPEYGCPVGNLSQEMSQASPEFQQALQEGLEALHGPMKRFLQQSRTAGVLRPDINPAEVSRFVIANYWGVRVLGRLGNSSQVYKAHLGEMSRYLSSLLTL